MAGLGYLGIPQARAAAGGSDFMLALFFRPVRLLCCMFALFAASRCRCIALLCVVEGQGFRRAARKCTAAACCRRLPWVCAGPLPPAAACTPAFMWWVVLARARRCSFKHADLVCASEAGLHTGLVDAGGVATLKETSLSCEGALRHVTAGAQAAAGGKHLHSAPALMSSPVLQSTCPSNPAGQAGAGVERGAQPRAAGGAALQGRGPRAGPGAQLECTACPGRPLWGNPLRQAAPRCVGTHLLAAPTATASAPPLPRPCRRPAFLQVLWLANVHLEGSPYRPNDRISQLKHALQRLEGHIGGKEGAWAGHGWGWGWAAAWSMRAAWRCRRSVLLQRTSGSPPAARESRPRRLTTTLPACLPACPCPPCSGGGGGCRHLRRLQFR